ncbi:ABC transporter permease [Aquimarina algiphila]|uniref:ABC transporter permease n=1 Tax=Aquimarina algiphila TaxID=2047982 RepID=UPI00232B7D44|nr:ABC transporter permease [Aquimarina algiphila]
MFKNHLKIAWRTIKNEKLFTFIKIGGLAIGIAACALIALFIQDELSYDQHIVEKDNVFRVYSEGVYDGDKERVTWFQAPFAKALKTDFPEIEKSGRYLTSELFGAGNKQLRIEGEIQNYFESNFIFADQELLELFEIPFVEGKIENALSEPATIVISQDKADKYFPNGNAVGNTLILDNDTNKPYKITGVMKNTSAKSHFDYDFIITMEGRDFYPGENENWRATNYYTYIKINDQTNVQQLEQKLLSVVEKYLIPIEQENGNADDIKYLKSLQYKLQPVHEIHLRSRGIQDGLKHSDIRFTWLFAAIAGFILILACINFINLSTAKSANRAKEVGLRKTIGAFRHNLVSQFLVESILFSLGSFVIGIGLAWLLLPMFNSVASKSLFIPWDQWWFILIMVASSLFIGFLAGLYPAYYLSSFKPIQVLKGSLSIGSKSGKLRSGLVIFQFTTSIVLIISTLVIHQQMDFILNKELGYSKDQVLVVKGTSTLGDEVENFKDQLLQLPEVKHVTISEYLPIEGTKRNTNQFWEDGKRETTIGGQIWRVDHDYLKTLGIKLKEGRDFSLDFASDSIENVIINQTLVTKLGLKDPIGKIITNGRPKTIIGVVEDFHLNNLKEDITPLVMAVGNSQGIISVKLSSAQIDSALSSIAAVWQTKVPNQSFRYTFLDQDFALMHEDVQRIGKIFNAFAFLAILVACLGLFALSAFMVEQRKKEISIRVVLGASFRSIYKLLTINFLKLIFVAVLISIPIAWYMMSRWLEDFAYRMSIGWELFVEGAIIALLIAIFTISYQSIGAALIKPLKSLRTE